MGCAGLDEYIQCVTSLVDSASSITQLVSDIAPLKKELLESPDFIEARFYDGLENMAYTRNLLHKDPDDRFSVMAIVWGPGRETPIHDHQTWGVVGAVDSGVSVIDFHSPDSETGELRERSSTSLQAGEVVEIIPPRLSNIHKMGNPSDHPLVSVHTYGDPAVLCRIYNPKNGVFSEQQLQFTHTR